MYSKQATLAPRYWQEGHLSFAGSAFVGVYNIGVVLAFQEFAPHIASRKSLGTSAGAILSMVLSTGIPMHNVIESFVRLCNHCREYTLGLLDPNSNLEDKLREELQITVPENGHKLASGRCFASLTEIAKVRNVIFSEFSSRDELMQVILASCFIPLISGLVPSEIRGVRYIDGGVTNNMPIHDENTITVCPFFGQGKIRPKNRFSDLPDRIFCWANMKRLAQALYAPPPKIQAKMFIEGYRDAISFIRDEDLYCCINCSRLTVKPQRGDCAECETLLKICTEAKVHPQLLKIFEDAQEREDALFQAHPFRYSKFGNIACVLLALLCFPINTIIAIALNVCYSRNYIYRKNER